MNLLVVRNSGESTVFVVIDDEKMEKIASFDAVKRKHHITGFEYVHPDDRKEYALDFLGLEKDILDPIMGDNIITVFRNKLTNFSENFSQFKHIYLL